MDNSRIWDQNTFSFALDFQKQIIIAMLQNKGVYDRLGLYIDYRYFENKDLSRIFKNLSEFTEKYKGFPSEESLIEQIAKGTEVSENLKEVVNDLYTAKRISKENVDFIEEEISKFIQCQELKKAIVSSIDYLGDVEKHESIKEKISEAINIGDKMEDLGTDVYKKENIVERILNRRKGEDIKRLLFRWHNMDKIFGGAGVGELFSFIGPSHSGKSMFLINAGVNFILQQLNVLHISLEMSEEVITQRYDMSLCGLTKEDLKTEKLVTELKARLRDKIGRVWVKQFPSDITTPSEITRFMNRLASAQGFVPDVLIVDYADIMSSPSKYHEKRHELGSIYRNLRNIGVEYKIPVLTATQMNRGALAKLDAGKLLDESDIAESYDIMRILDAGVSINSSIEDRHNHRANLYVVKNRDGDVGQQIKFYVDWSKAYCKEWENLPDKAA